MLETLLAIGKAISQGRDPWEDIIVPPKADDKDGKLRLYQLGIVFDLDQQQVRVEPAHLGAFSHRFEALKPLGALKIKGGNNKSLYPCVDAKKLEQLAKTLFGKDGAEQGEMLEKIHSAYPELAETPLVKVLAAIKPLERAFGAWFPQNDKGKYALDQVTERLSLEKSGRLVMIYAMVKWAVEGIDLQPLAQVEGFSELVERDFLKKTASSGAKEVSQKARLCYVTGDMAGDVAVAEFGDRYNLNKVFVQTTQNYATGFDKQAYSKNYQISAEVQTLLDRGSAHVLAHYKTRIAGLDHVIIPQVRGHESDIVDFSELDSLKAKSDLLFRVPALNQMAEELEDAEPQLMWINFVGIESDGNYFKVNSLIKDVPSFHFQRLLKTTYQSHRLFMPWLGDRRFNLNTVYGAIPIRKDQKQNAALSLFAAILEQRQVSFRELMRHFVHLILCHRYGRYKAWANIYDPQKEDYFDFLAKDAVFRYLAFIHTLRQLDQLKDHPFMHTEPTSAQSFAESQEAFFAQLGYTEPQKALFHLGRALNRTAFAQGDKGNKKRVLEKVNYNGMDAKALLRLHNDLFEKAKQYDIVDKVSWDLAAFSRYFQPQGWDMNPQEALFFLLSGYTYRIKKNSVEADDSSSVE
ncbi:MAG: hypothetical protein D6722_01040 [Bacteroidetes bacterium]|nr:MAG: hypothetical protein D6722_01040 [Bacteroidota bacterium]